MRILLQLLLTLFFAGSPTLSLAHELRPAYLELREVEVNTYEVLWKVPAKEELRLALQARLPEDCERMKEPRRHSAGGGWVDRWKVKCPSGLTGRRISVEGLSATLTDVLVRMESIDGISQTVRLTPSAPSFIVEAAPSRIQVARTYLGLGVEHILLGIDHLLFVLALLFLVRGFKPVLVTITAFTAAHSLTLAAATLGFVRIPLPPVEAVIALSIVFVACEIVRKERGREGLTARRPWLVAFSFGLLHGFGFAGALAEVSLPQKAIPLALLFFNLGVELGQVAFIGMIFTVVALFERLKLQAPGWTPTALAYAVGAMASFWMIQRIAAFFPASAA